MERPIFKVKRIGSFQRREGHIINRIRVKDTPKSVFGMIQTEVDELGESIEQGNTWEIMCEVADVMLLCARLATRTGFRLVDAITAKQRRNHDKYNPKKLRRLQDDWKLTPDQSMAFAKEHWDRGRDEYYFRRFASK